MSINQLFIERPSEKVEFFLRRHPIVFLGPIIVFLLLAALPFAADLVFLRGGPLVLSNELEEVGLKMLIGIYYLGIWIFFFTEFTDYYLDIDIITSDRIIDIDQRGLFGRSVSELDMTRVQDVHSEVKGIIQTLLDYGNVTVQTAAEEENFRFDQVPHPHRARQRIIELASLERRKEALDIMQAAPSVAAAAAAENDMKRQGLG